MPVKNIDWHFYLVNLNSLIYFKKPFESGKYFYQIRTRSSSDKYKASPGFTLNALYHASWLRGA